MHWRWLVRLLHWLRLRHSRNDVIDDIHILVIVIVVVVHVASEVGHCDQHSSSSAVDNHLEDDHAEDEGEDDGEDSHNSRPDVVTNTCWGCGLAANVALVHIGVVHRW